MRANVTTAFPGRPDNEVMTRTIAEGEVIFGDLAAVAIREGWAEDADDGETISPKVLSKMTVDQLRAYAGEHEIDLGQVTLKADLIAAITQAIAASTDV